MKELAPLISFLIPSRRRFDKLLAVIHSIHETCILNSLEIIIRLDVDDDESMSRRGELKGYTVMVGEGCRVNRKVDSSKLSALWDGPYKRAAGEWICPLSDDILFQTKGWDLELQKLPKTGLIVWPSVHRLNASEYLNDANSCLPFWPRGAVEKIIYPPDRATPNELRAKGWKDIFIPLTIQHNREADETLPASEY